MNKAARVKRNNRIKNNKSCASRETLRERAEYNNRKGRRARIRLAQMGD